MKLRLLLLRCEDEALLSCTRLRVACLDRGSLVADTVPRLSGVFSPLCPHISERGRVGIRKNRGTKGVLFG